jgi:hypothetical protein
MSFARLPPSSIGMYRTCGGAWGVDVTKVLLGASGFAEGPLATAAVVTEINSAAKQVRSGAVARRRCDRKGFRFNQQFVFIQTTKGMRIQSSVNFFGDLRPGLRIRVGDTNCTNGYKFRKASVACSKSIGANS